MVNVKSERETGDIAWFGIGCFHFGYKKTPPYKFRRSDYVRDLKAALEAIAAIKDVVINCPANEVTEEEIDVIEAPTALSEGEGHFPPIGVGWIRFRIYIPARLQKEIGGKFAADDAATENFVVFINYVYEGPVAYVLLDDPTSHDCEPSTAVMIVREFLARELDRGQTSVRFESLGPSPFHADCSLRLIDPAGAGEGKFEVNHIHKHEYDSLQFTSDHPEYNSAWDAVQDLFRELDHELGPYYWIQATEAESIHAWRGIQKQVGELLNLSERSTIWQRVKARTKRSALLHDVFTSLIGFDVSRTFMLNQRDQGYRETYAAGPGYLREFVDSERKDAVHYPTRQITTLVGFLERRRSKAVELGIILVAAVVGGIAGATITHSPPLPSLHGPSVVQRIFGKSPSSKGNALRRDDAAPTVGIPQQTQSPNQLPGPSHTVNPRH